MLYSVGDSSNYIPVKKISSIWGSARPLSPANINKIKNVRFASGFMEGDPSFLNFDPYPTPAPEHWLRFNELSKQAEKKNSKQTSIFNFLKKHPKKFIAAGLGLGFIGLRFSAKDNNYNNIEGLHPGSSGLGALNIKRNTDFGSGYKGLPTSLAGQTIDPRILEFRENVLNDPEAKADFEADVKQKQAAALENLGSLKQNDLLSLGDSKLKGINLSNFRIEAEDADTLTLRRTGLLGFFQNPIQIRLKGIDAPEIASHETDPIAEYRIWQQQLGGSEAGQYLSSLVDNARSVQLKVDPSDKTYGRYVGSLYLDGQNAAEKLVSEGIVTALPFGESSQEYLKKLEEKAKIQRKGIWSFARYQAIGEATQSLGNEITHNTLTSIDKLAGNLSLGAYASFLEGLGSEERALTQSEAEQAQRFGRMLRKQYGPRFKNFNTIEGLHPGGSGLGTKNLKETTPFGSGFNRIKNLAFNWVHKKTNKALGSLNNFWGFISGKNQQIKKLAEFEKSAFGFLEENIEEEKALFAHNREGMLLEMELSKNVIDESAALGRKRIQQELLEKARREKELMNIFFSGDQAIMDVDIMGGGYTQEERKNLLFGKLDVAKRRIEGLHPKSSGLGAQNIKDTTPFGSPFKHFKEFASNIIGSIRSKVEQQLFLKGKIPLETISFKSAEQKAIFYGNHWNAIKPRKQPVLKRELSEIEKNFSPFDTYSIKDVDLVGIEDKDIKYPLLIDKSERIMNDYLKRLEKSGRLKKPGNIKDRLGEMDTYGNKEAFERRLANQNVTKNNVGEFDILAELEKQKQITQVTKVARNKRFAKKAQEAVGIGLRSSHTATKGHISFNSTNSWVYNTN